MIWHEIYLVTAAAFWWWLQRRHRFGVILRVLSAPIALGWPFFSALEGAFWLMDGRFPRPPCWIWTRVRVRRNVRSPEGLTVPRGPLWATSWLPGATLARPDGPIQFFVDGDLAPAIGDAVPDWPALVAAGSDAGQLRGYGHELGPHRRVVQEVRAEMAEGLRSTFWRD